MCSVARKSLECKNHMWTAVQERCCTRYTGRRREESANESDEWKPLSPYNSLTRGSRKNAIFTLSCLWFPSWISHGPVFVSSGHKCLSPMHAPWKCSSWIARPRPLHLYPCVDAICPLRHTHTQNCRRKQAPTSTGSKIERKSEWDLKSNKKSPLNAPTHLWPLACCCCCCCCC